MVKERRSVKQKNKHKYSHLVFGNVQTIQWRKDFSSTNDARTTGHPYAKKNKNYLNLYFHFIQKKKKKLKMDHRPKCKYKSIKGSRKTKERRGGKMMAEPN